MQKIDWSNIFKIRIAQSNKSMAKHEVVKILLVMRIMEKYKSNKSWIRIYTEFSLDNGLRPDVYFENVKTKEAIAYEIQKEYTPLWITKKEKQYSEWQQPFFKTNDFIPIDLTKFPKDIDGIWEKLEEYVF